MMEHKRSPVSIEQSSLASLTPKRHKVDDISISSKERKEKVGERIAALQQLVSPFGKVKVVKPSTLQSSDFPFDTRHCDRTDTASVLLEAMGYISFLHEQVKVLSAPYLHSTSLEIIQGSESYNLRSKGLCLAPISCTAGVASTNGADIWAPTKSVSPKY